MNDLAVTVGAGILIGTALVLATRQQQAPADPGADGGFGSLPDLGGFVPDFGLTGANDTSAPADTYSSADVAGVPVEGDSQLPGVLDSAMTAIDPTQFMNTSTASSQYGDANVRAFLDMIAFSEGTSGPDGYRYMFGYPQNPDRLITSFADHPRQYFSFTVGGKTYKTSAAGRYQFLASTWDDLKRKLGLVDFSPASQDAAAIELIRQRGALNDVRAGRIATAITKCAKTWASLPGAGYGQPEQKLATLMNQYAAAGGTTLSA